MEGPGIPNLDLHKKSAPACQNTSSMIFIFLMLGISGLYGAIKGINNNSKTSKCLIGFFSIGVFVFFALFLAGTIFFFVGPQTIFGTD